MQLALFGYNFWNSNIVIVIYVCIVECNAVLPIGPTRGSILLLVGGACNMTRVVLWSTSQ